jgi:hypothetical protein
VKPVEDPALLEILEGKKPIEDPGTLARLERKPASDTAVAVNAANKGLAAIPDMFLNAPQNVINLGKAAVGMGAHAIGKPEWAPDVSDPPNLARKGFEKAGFIRPEAEPQNARQRIIDTMLQAGSQFVASPAKSITQAAGNLVTGLTSGGVGGVTAEATGSDAAGATAAMLTSLRPGSGKQMNPVKEKTLRDAQGDGYVVPPSEIKPDGVKGFVNKVVEGLGGKAAVGQEASNRNQQATNVQAARELGMPPDTPMTPDVLRSYRDSVSAPYKQVAAISPVAASALDRLKEARRQASLHYDHYKAQRDPKALKEAEAFQQQAEMLETTLEKAAARAGKPGLVDELRQARQQIAKSYDVERNLNLGSGDVSAAGLGKMYDKDAPVSGGLKRTAAFAEAFPAYARDGQKITTPGVSKLDGVVAAMMGAGGMATLGPWGASLAAVPYASHGARALALSKPYQKLMTKSSPGMVPDEQALRALLLARAVAERRQGAEE